MQSPPTLPRRRGRLQPELHGCGLVIDGLRSSLQQRIWAAGPLPGRSAGFAARRHYLRHSVSCLSSIEKTAPSFTFDIPPDLVAELYIVASRFDACDSQALVVVDRSIPIVLALVGTPVVFPRRGHLECRDREQGEIPESNALRSWAAAEKATSPNAIEASNTPRILASRNVCIDCVAAIEEGLIRAADARYSALCRNSWRRRVRSARSASSRRGPLR
jgi:hypothetical protein